MKKAESTLSYRLARTFLRVLVLASFLFSLEAGLLRSRGQSEEKTGAIYAANASQRDLALANSQNTRADRSLSKSKPEKHRSQAGNLPVEFIAPQHIVHTLLFGNDSSLVCSSSYYSQPRGRAPPVS